jgi:NADPH-dependent 2,4-dienoyl-CoA reductase/sulfur reductase-like enzyme
VIIGGGVGGCAAALAATQLGARVILTEETDWLGGQLTQQAVPPDENPWIESQGGTRSYLQYRSLVRKYYRHHYPLAPELRETLGVRLRWEGV